jgi:YD repeat-containing protein
MRALFLSFVFVSVCGVCQPPVPPARWFAPNVTELRSGLDQGQAIYGDTVYQYGQRLKIAHTALSGTVLSMYGDSTLHTVSQYTNGRHSGTWYALDALGHVTEIIEYTPDNTRHSYWYDPQGRLTYSCTTTNCADDSFDRVFGGGCPGTCWNVDSARHVTHMLREDTTGYSETVEYYPNGQPAQRKSHDLSSTRIEQWCPKGKRIGFVENVQDSATAELRMEGTIILWSVRDYAYYACKRTKTNWQLKELQKGRLRTYTEEEYAARESELNLKWIVFNDPKRPAVLPCSLPAR